MAYSPSNPYTEDTAHVSGDKGTEVLAVRNDTRGALADVNGDYSPIQVNASGDLRTDSSAVTQPVSIAAGATTVAKAEDVASADGDVGVPALAVRKATPANTSGTDGDYEFLQVSAGRLWASATIDAALPTGANAIGKLAANSGVIIGAVEQSGANWTINNAQINGVTPLMGNGVTGTGSQRVTIASDNTPFPVKIDQTTPGTTNKIAISDALGNATNSAATGFLKVSDEPRQIFYDPFDATPDTTNMWTSTTGSSGVAAAVATGVLSMGTGVAASGYSKFTTIPTFKPVIPGWIVYSDAIQIPDAGAPTANALRLWGAGTTPATPTLALPITDGYFFELSSAGVLSAVVYAGGTRTQIATSLTLSTGYVRYIIQVRTDKTYFFINSIDSAGLVATTNFQSPQVQTLPKLYLAVGNTPTAPVSNAQIQSTGAVVSDTGKNATLIADGTFPWRRQTVKAASTAAAATDLPAVVALHPTSPVPAGSSIIGKVGIDQTTPGTTNLVALAANQSVNVAQINGVTPLMGNGVTGTGSQRVTIASDNTAFAVNATLQTGSNVIGSLAANQSINNAQVSGVAISTGNGITGTGVQRVTIASDNTAFAVNATLQANSGVDIGKLTANQSTNMAQVAGTATDTNSGLKSAGTIRVVLATDQPALTNKLLVTPDSVALPANQSVNVSQVNGVTTLMGNGVTGTGSQRVTVASDNTPFPIKFDQTTVGTTNAVSIAQLGANTIASGNGTSSTGTLRVAIASDNTANSNPFLTRHAAATTSSGLLNAKILAAASTNATSTKGSAAALYGWHLVNNATSTRYFRVFNKATAPTVGTDSPIFVLPLPAGGGAVMTPATMNFALGTGFAYAITAGAVDLDTTICAANDVIGTIWYV